MEEVPKTRKLPTIGFVLVRFTAGLVVIVFAWAVWQQQSFKAEQQAEAAATKVRVERETFLQQSNAVRVAEETARREQETATTKEREAREKQAAELAAYKTRHLGNQTARHKVAVLIVSEDGRPNLHLGHALVSLLNDAGLPSTASLFTGEFVADGLFRETLDGSRTAINRLDVPQLAEALLLGRQTVSYGTDATLGGLVTARMEL